MTQTSREHYSSGNVEIDRILQQISDRLDKMEGIRPKRDSGLFLFDSDSAEVSTTPNILGQWNGGATGLNAATGRASLGLGSFSVEELISIKDASDTIIHQFPVALLAITSEMFGFY